MLLAFFCFEWLQESFFALFLLCLLKRRGRSKRLYQLVHHYNAHIFWRNFYYNALQDLQQSLSIFVRVRCHNNFIKIISFQKFHVNAHNCCIKRKIWIPSGVVQFFLIFCVSVGEAAVVLIEGIFLFLGFVELFSFSWSFLLGNQPRFQNPYQALSFPY